MLAGLGLLLPLFLDIRRISEIWGRTVPFQASRLLAKLHLSAGYATPAQRAWLAIGGTTL